MFGSSENVLAAAGTWRIRTGTAWPCSEVSPPSFIPSKTGGLKRGLQQMHDLEDIKQKPFQANQLSKSNRNTKETGKFRLCKHDPARIFRNCDFECFVWEVSLGNSRLITSLGVLRLVNSTWDPSFFELSLGIIRFGTFFGNLFLGTSLGTFCLDTIA